jgi:phosphoserine phosphatase
MPLILQSLSPLANADLDTLRTVAGASAFERRADNVAAADDCAPLTPALREALDAACAPRGIDWAVVPGGRKLSDFRLVAMDMDSTLITIECIDEIADFCGLKAEVSAITEAAMRGEITDFNESLRRRVALLKAWTPACWIACTTNGCACHPAPRTCCRPSRRWACARCWFPGASSTSPTSSSRA